jgi:hypothetical protein
MDVFKKGERNMKIAFLVLVSTVCISASAFAGTSVTAPCEKGFFFQTTSQSCVEEVEMAPETVMLFPLGHANGSDQTNS